MRLVVALVCLLASACTLARRPAPQPPPSVLVIVADSLRCDRLRLFNPEDGVATPAIEELARRGIVFTNAWAVAPWTAPSVVSLFTGLYPPSHGVVFRDDTTPRSLHTLPRVLATRGYRLGNFAFFSDVSYFRNLGFPEAQPGLGHETASEAFGAWLRGGQPFLAWVHLLETHLPYGATGYAATRVRVHGSSGLEMAQLRAEVPYGAVTFAPGDREKLVALYDEDVRALDAAVARVLKGLREAGFDEQTVVVFVADHGEELLDHGWVGHASTSLRAKLVPEILHVPLILTGPGMPGGVRTAELAQQVDILPTLCRLLGIRPPHPLDGVPLLPLRRVPPRRLAFFDTAVGGNLTPEAERGERLQGLSDGRWLLARHEMAGAQAESAMTALAGAAPPPPAVAEAFGRALAAWQRRQAQQRLALLTHAPRLALPPEETLTGFAETVAVTQPGSGAVLEWRGTGGMVALRWKGTGDACLVEYRVGSGIDTVTGRVEADTGGLSFGPFPEGFWNELAAHNPFRFRVVDPQRRLRSPWIEFRIAPSESRGS